MRSDRTNEYTKFRTDESQGCMCVMSNSKYYSSHPTPCMGTQSSKLAGVVSRRRTQLPARCGAIGWGQSAFRPAGDDRSGRDCLAKGRRCAQDPGIVREHGSGGGFLLVPEFAGKRQLERTAREPFVYDVTGNAVLTSQIQRRIETAPWQGNVLRIVLRLANDTRRVPHRHAHRLGPVELRVLEGGQSDQLGN